MVQYKQRDRYRDMLIIFIILYIVLGAYLALMQENIIYQPYPQDFGSCPELASAEKISHDGTRMYFKDNGSRLAILYHGNAGSACANAVYADIFERAGYSYLLPEYAGYSNDPASPTHELLKKDVLHTVDFVQRKHFSEIVVVGESIGSGFAAYHLSLAPAQKAILISPYTSLIDLAKVHYWYYPVSLLVKDPFDMTAFAKNFKGKVLVIQGGNDTIIPPRLGQRFFESLITPNKEMVVLPDAGHNDLFAFPKTEEAIRDLLK